MKFERWLAESTLEDVEAEGQFDAIVVGAGAAGGMAAALLTEAGLSTLVLDAGIRSSFIARPISWSIAELVRVLARPDAVKYLSPKVVWKAQTLLRLAGRRRQPVQARCYAWPTAPRSFVDDNDNPYETDPDAPFVWIRTRQLGGRMIVPAHGRQYYRHSEQDFAPTDDLSPAWPVSAEEMAAWYCKIEKQLGLSGRVDGIPHLPDSEIAEQIAPLPQQSAMMQQVAERWPGASAVVGRFAAPMSTLDMAARTGRLSYRKGAIVWRVETGPDGRAEGVVFHDQRIGRNAKAAAPLVFLCASSLETTRILMLSRSARCPEGLGGQSGALGRFIMDHVSVKAEGVGPDLGSDAADLPVGSCVYLPRFDLRNGFPPRQESTVVGRGFSVRIYQIPGPAGTSFFTAVADSEIYPRAENRVSLSEHKDLWGIPVLKIRCAYGPEEQEMARRQAEALRELTDLLGVTLRDNALEPSVPGSAIHETGGARMGTAPETSVLDPHNQCWDAPGLYVTDGAAFPSIGLVNPTLTILALTARACAHALGANHTL